MQVPALLHEYKGCLATRKFDEAEKINKEINDFITNEINTTGRKLKRFAHDRLFKADRFEESIPLFFAAASLHKKERMLQWMSECVGVRCEVWWGGMHKVNKKMIARDVTMKDVVKRHVIPLMHDIKNQMLEVTPVSEKDLCWCMSHVFKYIAESEELVNDDVAAKKARDESRVWLKERLGKEQSEEEKEQSQEETRSLLHAVRL